MSSTKYDENSIQVLEGLEAVRKRPGMYIGNVDTKGLHHLAWEIIDNSIDEALAGFANEIFVKINKDESIIIMDNGRGIPIKIHPKTGKSTIETVFTILHAGGKFGGDNSGYKVSGGLHGVGASVVNALSDFVNISVYRDGIESIVKFKEGGEISSGIIGIGTTERTGTTVHFLPTFSTFNDGVQSFDIEIIEKRLKETAYLNRNLKITIEDEREDNYKKEFLFEGGLIDYINDLNKNKEKITNDVIYSEGEKDNVHIEVAMQYTTSYQPNIISFVNNIATTEGGTHEQGFQDAIVRIINNYTKDNLPQKEQQTFTREDVKEGLVAVISIEHPDPM